MHRSRARNLIGWLGLFLVGCLATERLVALAKAPPTDFDDAYMYLRYGKLTANTGQVSGMLLVCSDSPAPGSCPLSWL